MDEPRPRQPIGRGSIPLNILLSSIGRRSYLARYFVAALAGRGTVFGANCRPHTPGLSAVDVPLIVPAAHERMFLPRMLQICREHAIDLLISLHDFEVMMLSRYCDEFEEIGTRVLVPDAPSCEVCVDKYVGNRYLRDRGIWVPSTCFGGHGPEQKCATGDIRLPAVVKPRWGAGSQGLYVAHESTDLPMLCKLAIRDFERSPFVHVVDHADGECALVQELVTGEEFGLNVINDLEGEYVTSFVCRKLGMRAGETDAAETVAEPVLERLGERIGQLVRHRGVLDVDIVLRAGRPYVLDMNPRFGGQYPFWHEAGADIPSALIAWRKGERPEPDWLRTTPGIRYFKDISLVPGTS